MKLIQKVLILFVFPASVCLLGQTAFASCVQKPENCIGNANLLVNVSGKDLAKDNSAKTKRQYQCDQRTGVCDPQIRFSNPNGLPMCQRLNAFQHKESNGNISGMLNGKKLDNCIFVKVGDYWVIAGEHRKGYLDGVGYRKYQKNREEIGIFEGRQLVKGRVGEGYGEGYLLPQKIRHIAKLCD